MNDRHILAPLIKERAIAMKLLAQFLRDQSGATAIE
jgi:Flp pilus assembly protein TadG